MFKNSVNASQKWINNSRSISQAVKDGYRPLPGNRELYNPKTGQTLKMSDVHNYGKN